MRQKIIHRIEPETYGMTEIWLTDEGGCLNICGWRFNEAGQPVKVTLEFPLDRVKELGEDMLKLRGLYEDE